MIYDTNIISDFKVPNTQYIVSYQYDIANMMHQVLPIPIP